MPMLHNRSDPAAITVSRPSDPDNAKDDAANRNVDLVSLALSILCFLLVVTGHILLLNHLHDGYKLLLTKDVLGAFGKPVLRLGASFVEVLSFGVNRRAIFKLILLVFFTICCCHPRLNHDVALPSNMQDSSSPYSTCCGCRKRKGTN